MSLKYFVSTSTFVLLFSEISLHFDLVRNKPLLIRIAALVIAHNNLFDIFIINLILYPKQTI